MKFDSFRTFRSKTPESMPGPSPEEFAFMERAWYHGSPKPGIEKLLPGGKRFLSTEDGVHIALSDDTPKRYGKYISEWRLKGPLKIIGDLDTAEPVDKKALQRAGYVGYFWTSLGSSTGVVWDGDNLEKIAETTNEG